MGIKCASERWTRESGAGSTCQFEQSVNAALELSEQQSIITGEKVRYFVVFREQFSPVRNYDGRTHGDAGMHHDAERL